MRQKKSRLYLIIFQWFVILLGYVLLCNRIRFGIDFTDESWYVAEPYIVADGAIPYVNNWTQASGFSLPLASLFKIYVAITGGTEGIVLFSRVLYVIISLIVYTISFIIITKSTKQFGMFIVVFPLLFIHIFSLYDLNYNTMGVIYLLIGCVLLFFTKEDKKASIISGVIIARGIIASPSLLAAWGGILLLLAIRKQKYRLRQFILGNAVATVLVIGWCCVRGSISGFLNGMRVFLTGQGYFQIEKVYTMREEIVYAFNYGKPLIVTTILLVALEIVWKKSYSQEKQHRWHNCIVILICACCLLLGTIKAVYFRSYLYLIQYGWFEAIIMAVFVKAIDEEKRNAILRFAWISGLYFVVYFLSSATNVYGFTNRDYWLVIPTLLGFLSWYFVLDGKNLAMFAVFAMNLLMGFLLVKQNYEYVYRDQPIANLTQKVEYGIWKGCYTTPKRVENVELLEKYIRSITNRTDDVLFLDQVCFAYLMTEGKACSPATNDPMSFSYKVDIPEVMYEYFKSIGKTPNKIIYIDFGRDEGLSIDSDWKFNKFVNENYELVETYDTNPEIEDKFAEGSDNTASFYVKYYMKRKNK